MRKFLSAFFVSAAALIIVGCSRAEMSAPEAMSVVSFALRLDEQTTKSAVYGETVNRYIVEAYTAGGGLYTRVEKTVESGTLHTEMTLELVAGQTYTFLCFADCSDNGNDLCYDTSLGLKALGLKGEYTGGCREREAFAAAVTMKVSDSISEIELTRPFAQLNIITKDIGRILNDGMLPKSVTVGFNACTHYNIATGEPFGEPFHFEYTAQPYEKTSDSEWILSMDYMFAPGQEAVLGDVSLGVEANGNVIDHVFHNVPFKRNYRTNIIGNAMTVDGSFNVSISPDWDGEDDNIILSVPYRG